MAARPSGLDQQRREPLHPPVQRDVIDFDASLGEEFLEVAIRQAEAQVPADRQQDYLRLDRYPAKATEPRRVCGQVRRRVIPSASPRRDDTLNATVPPPSGHPTRLSACAERPYATD